MDIYWSIKWIILVRSFLPIRWLVLTDKVNQVIPISTVISVISLIPVFLLFGYIALFYLPRFCILRWNDTKA